MEILGRFGVHHKQREPWKEKKEATRIRLKSWEKKGLVFIFYDYALDMRYLLHAWLLRYVISFTCVVIFNLFKNNNYAW